MRLKAEERLTLEQVQDLILDIQELGSDVCFEYFGTTNVFKVDVCKNGWCEDTEKDYQISYCLSSGKASFYDESVDENIGSLKFNKIRSIILARK